MQFALSKKPKKNTHSEGGETLKRIDKSSSSKMNENSNEGLIGVSLVIVASAVAAPFTSIWVPIFVLGFFTLLILLLTISNLLHGGTLKNAVYKSFAQIDSIVSFAANYLRF